MRFVIMTLLLSGMSSTVWAFGSGAGTCDVVADYSTITAMGSRFKNPNHGDYELTANVDTYNTTEHVEITLTAGGSGDQSTFTGLVVSVVDDVGNQVGTFNFDEEIGIHECGGSAMMAATHNGSHGDVMSRTLFWVPPSELVGDVYVLAYVLSGVRGSIPTQQFYRFVREDGSALMIEEQEDLIFYSGFE
ncbi:MAG: reeler domain-containing protein [Marinicella sp.]